MATHVIIGTGTAPKNAVEESLLDVMSDGDDLSLQWAGIPADDSAYDTIFRVLRDKEIPFTLFHTEEDKIPQELRSWPNASFSKSRDSRHKAVESMTSDGSLMYLWGDDDVSSAEVEWLFDTFGGITVLELSNGLTPIIIEDAPPPPVQAPVVEEEPIKELTQMELEVMTAGAVKDYGAKMGCTAVTKSGIIEELFPAIQIESVDQSDLDTLIEEIDSLLIAESEGDDDFVSLYNKFIGARKSGVQADLANLAINEARLWMHRSLGE